MKQDEYNLLLEELDDIKRLWMGKEYLSKLEIFKIQLKYWLFNRKINRLRKRK
jgi:hypothetical protein